MIWLYVTAYCSSLNWFWKNLLPSDSLLNKIIEGDTNIIKTVNLICQNESLSKEIIFIFDIYLQPCAWFSEGGIIGLRNKNESYTYYDKTSTYN